MICALAHPPAEIDVSLNTESIAYALTGKPHESRQLIVPSLLGFQREAGMVENDHVSK